MVMVVVMCVCGIVAVVGLSTQKVQLLLCLCSLENTKII